MLGDEAVACHYCPSEKMLTAFFRMSRSRVTCPARGADAGPLRPGHSDGRGFFPRSRSAFFHRLMTPLLIPRRGSTPTAVLPSSEAMRMTSSLKLSIELPYHENTSCAKI